tara:strand:+ start:519 stop:737 length:219 start_codon:yes stop_codon:yes gene_type:complete
MVYHSVSDELLDNFISKRYHWRSIPSHNQMDMAIELKKHRMMQGRYIEMIEGLLQSDQDHKMYRELVYGVKD